MGVAFALIMVVGVSGYISVRYAAANWRMRQLEAAKENYFVHGMSEVNRFLAPYQTPDETERVDIGCQLCDVMCMDTTHHELDAAGWTNVDDVSRCPDCSAGKPARKLEKKAYPQREGSGMGADIWK